MTVVLRGGQETNDRRLDRLVPPDDAHLRKWSVASAPSGALQRAPVALAVNWYSSFFDPEEVRVGGRREFWIGRRPLGYVAGGHCVASPHDTARDRLDWWRLMDQGQEGACVGFGATRVMMLLNRRRYDPRWLYLEAQRGDDWEGGAYEGADPVYEGTSLRAAMDVLRDQGHVVVSRGRSTGVPRAAEGIAANRWALTVDDVRAVHQNPRYDEREAIPILNSWGASWPHVVWLPYTVLERLLREDGEASMITDR